MIAIGEQHVASSLTAIIIASVPLIGTVLALRFDPSERPTPLRAAGLAVGFLGVIALVGIDIAGRTDELLGAGAILIAATGYAIGPIVLKQRLDGLDAPTLMGGSLVLGTVMLTPLAAIDLPSRVPSAGALGSLAVLAVLCTALAFVVITILIREAGTSRAMVITYVNPVIALALGMILLSERPGAGAIAGLVLILAGSWLSTTGRLPGVAPRSPGNVASSPADQPASDPVSAGAVAGARPSAEVPREPARRTYDRGVN
jgi:drug/metabolite transporter (DMT)-like permease